MSELDTAIDAYFSAKEKIHKLFDYQPDWVDIPLDDARAMYWMLVNGEAHGGFVVYAEEPLTPELFSAEPAKTFYSCPIYTQRFLPKWVYRTPTHVLVSADTQTDGNKFLMIFDASKECVVDEDVREAYREFWG